MEAGRKEGRNHEKKEGRRNKRRKGGKRDERRNSNLAKAHKCVEECNIIMTCDSNTVSVITSY